MKTSRVLLAQAALFGTMALACVGLGEPPPDADAGGGTGGGTGDLVCSPNDLGFVYFSDGTPQTRCFGEQKCVTGLDGQAECGCEREGLRCVYDAASGLPDLHVPSRVSHAYACPSDNSDPNHPNNVVEECGPGFMCVNDEDFNGGVATCASTIAPEAQDHPLAEFGCVGFTELFIVPTKLGVDCRCRITEEGALSRGDANGDHAWPGGDWPQGSLRPCQSESIQLRDDWRIPAGSGPKFDGWKENGNETWTALGIDEQKRELYATVRHVSPYFAKPTSSIVGTSRSCALRSFEPGDSPTTT